MTNIQMTKEQRRVLLIRTLLRGKPTQASSLVLGIDGTAPPHSELKRGRGSGTDTILRSQHFHHLVLSTTIW